MLVNEQDIIQYSFKNNLSHIPSALSMLQYLNFLFKYHFVEKDDIIILGKPFGAQAYYLIWKNLGWLDNIEELGAGVKHDEISFVDYSEETIGNALGVAIGMAIAEPQKKVWVNLTDATLQMGNTLEAIQYIGQHKITNIVVTIDNNNMQVTGTTRDVIAVDPIFKMFEDYDWDSYHCHLGNDYDEVHSILDEWNITYEEFKCKPSVIIFDTIKGFGVSYMEKNPKAWHYKKLTEECII